MRATVFTDRALAKQAGRFVWLSIDTEDARNAEFLERYPWEAVPTFEIIEPRSEAVAYRWLGAVDVAQLLERLDEAAVGLRPEGADEGRRLYARAQRLDGEGRKDEAAAAYDEALQAGTLDEGTRARTVEALINAIALSGERSGECARRALELGPTLPAGISRANVAIVGLDCALGLERDAPDRVETAPALEAQVREALGFPGLLDDDRAGLYATLIDAADGRGDDAGTRAAVGDLQAFLDEQAKAAPSVEARAALDGFRVSAALAAEDPARALPALEASERDLPDDYNPPARLAVLLRELGRYDEALAASDRALARAYGPRKLSIYDGRATILEKNGDPAGARTVLEEALAYAATLPEAQRSRRAVARLASHLDKLQGQQP